MIEENDYVFFEGDDINNIHFLREGNCGFVMPKYNNKKYVDIKQGSQFGVIDIIACVMEHDEFDLDNWLARKDLLRRQFTIMASTKSTLLSFSVHDFNRMKCEFLEVHNQLFN